MKPFKCAYFIDSNGRQVNLLLADTFMARLKGLFSKVAKTYDGVHISPCNSVHTMLFNKSIDVVFLSKDGRILKCVKAMKSNRVSFCIGAHSVVEIFSDRYSYDFVKGESFYV